MMKHLCDWAEEHFDEKVNDIILSNIKPFDRVHRLGQQKNVFVECLVIENIAEDRILALQERKVGLVYHVCISIYYINSCPEESC